jgi:hypothetical protein
MGGNFYFFYYRKYPRRKNGLQWYLKSIIIEKNNLVSEEYMKIDSDIHFKTKLEIIRLAI